MQLAKPHLDIGLFTNRRDAHLTFWREVAGLQFDHMAKLGGGIHQYRFFANGSIIKVNDSRAALRVVAPAGIVQLMIARPDAGPPTEVTDPDGNQVALVPRGERGINGIGIKLAVNDLVVSGNFYAGAMGMERAGVHAYRCGDSLIVLQPSVQPLTRPEYRGLGFRYLTVQVHDCDAAHAAILSLGGLEGRPPLTLGETARFSFVRDPDGNWIEISERRSLTGKALRD